MDRRDFFIGVAAVSLGGIHQIAHGTENRVQLLLLRQRKEPLSCGPIRYMPGKLYGVPVTIPLPLATLSSGLTHIADTEEPLYQDNEPFVSSVPRGTYQGFIKDEETKSWMVGKPNRAWRIELEDTEPRTEIQFHYGDDYTWSEGCIILVGKEANGPVCAHDDSPESAVIALREYVESIGLNKDVRIDVRIDYA